MTPMAPPRKNSIAVPRYVYSTVSRGRRFWFYWHKRGQPDAGKRIPVPDPETGLEFWSAYKAAVAASTGPLAPKHGTFAALIAEYKASPKWQTLSEGNQRNWSYLLAKVETLWGDLQVADLTAPPIQAAIDGMASTPATANNFRRALSAMIKWSIPRGWRESNPCRDVETIEGGEAYAAWPTDIIELASKLLPAELWWAAALAYYTGQRLGDCLEMKWSDIRGAQMAVVPDLYSEGRVSVQQEKTGKKVLVPIHSSLASVLRAIPRRHATLGHPASEYILTGKKGGRWTKSGFASSWQKAVRGAPDRKHIKGSPGIDALKPYVFHGLRKSAVVALLEVGCTTAEVAAVTGQSQKMVEHYAKDVNRDKLASTAIQKWERNTG